MKVFTSILALLIYSFIFGQKEYFVTDIKKDEIRYFIFLQEKNKNKKYVLETLKDHDIDQDCNRIKKGDTLKLKLIKNKPYKFKTSLRIRHYDKTAVYKKQGYINDYYIFNLKGLCLVEK